MTGYRVEKEVRRYLQPSGYANCNTRTWRTHSRTENTGQQQRPRSN